MVKLNKYDKPEFIGKITLLEIKPLSEHIDPQYHEHFSKLERENIVLWYRYEDRPVRDWFCMIPDATGYSKSNLKKLRDKNPELPDDTDDWVGKEILLKLDAKGYLTVAL